MPLGCFYVVGVGPGDPELVTLKAARILSSVPVVFVPQKAEDGESYAQGIIAGMLRPEQKVIGLVFPMTRDGRVLAEHWEKAAQSIWRHLKEGEDCALVNLGDPLLYGTGIHVIEELRRGHSGVRIEIVPGVSSITAGAARAGIALAVNDERMAIISGNCEEKTITETLERFDTVVFLKVHTAFDRLIGILDRMKRLERCVYISRGTTEDEDIVRDISSLKGKKLNYLSLLIVRR